MCYWDQTKWREISPEGSYAKRWVSSTLSTLSKSTLFRFLSASRSHGQKPPPLPSNKSMTILVSKSGNLSIILGHRLQPKIYPQEPAKPPPRLYVSRIGSTEQMASAGSRQNSPIAMIHRPLWLPGGLWRQPCRSIFDNHLLDVPDVKDVSPGNFRGCLLVGVFSYI